MSRGTNYTADYVNRLLDREAERQRPLHEQWLVNMAYSAGKQWVIYNEEHRCVQEIVRTKAHQVRLVINLCNSVVWRRIAQLIRARPQPQAIPMSQSEGDRMAARAWQIYFDDVWRRENIRAIVRDEVLWWSSHTGRGWLRVAWDPDRGEVRRIALPSEPTEDDIPEEEQGNLEDGLLASMVPEEIFAPRSPDRTAIPLGGPRVSCPAPFNVFMDPSASRVDDAKWILEVSFVPRQAANERFGTRKLEADVQSNPTPSFTARVKEGVTNLWGNLTNSFMGMDASSGKYNAGLGLNEGDDFSDMVLMKELFVRPSDRHPEGRYVVVINDRVVHQDDSPYDGELPYALLQDDPCGGTQYGNAPMTFLRDPQTLLNRLISARVQNINQFNRPHWTVPHQAKVDPDDINDQATIVRYQANQFGAVPNLLPPPSLGTADIEAINIAMMFMDRIAGLQKASVGVNPEGVRSARALTQLQESDEEGRAPLQERFTEFLTRGFQLIMRISKKYIREDRLLRIVGQDGVALAIEFTKAMVEAGFDVQVVTAAGLPKSPEGRLNAIMSMLQGGLLNPADPNDRKLAFRALEFGELSSVLDNDEGPERNRIYAENLTMLNGGQVQVKNYDRHLLHIDDHSRYMRSVEAQEVFRQNPQVEQMFIAHLDQHIDFAEVPAANPASPLEEPMMGDSMLGGQAGSPTPGDMAAMMPPGAGASLAGPGGMGLPMGPV